LGRVIFGCNALSSLPSRRHAFKLLESAIEAGITHFDTAPAYGVGYSEKILGEFLRAHGSAARITTKIGLTNNAHAGLPSMVALPLNYVAKSIMGLARKPNTATTKIERPALSIKLPTIEKCSIERSLENSVRLMGGKNIKGLLLHEALPCQLSHGARNFIGSLLRRQELSLFGVGARRSLIERGYYDDPLVSVLQYDAPDAVSAFLIEKFPSTYHCHHGILHGAEKGSHAKIIAERLAENPNIRVVFSTRHPSRIRDNVGAV
jgi:aryl-alcohol dehydrogenase-like predicted oxidoreductase